MTTSARTYTVPTISCDRCKQAIEAEIAPLPGVESVQVDVATKTVTISGGDPNSIEAAINNAGYTIEQGAR
jgi:copper chaperone